MWFKVVWEFIKPFWKIIVGVIAVIGLLVGAYMYVDHQGFKRGDLRATQRIAAYEQQIKDKGAKIEKGQFVLDKEVITEYRDKIQKIYIEKEVNRSLAINNVKNTGNLPAGWIYVHNLSATGGKGEPQKAMDSTDSTIASNIALATVSDNYAACKAEVGRLQAWQSWYVKSKANIEEANEK
jgi:hypothetical protein